MYYNILLTKYFEFVINLINYDVFNYFNLHNKISTPHTLLLFTQKYFNNFGLNNKLYSPHTHSPNNNMQNQAALGAIYHNHPPGFQYTNKTAFAVTNSNMANTDTGVTGSYIATRDTQCLHNVVSCNPATIIQVEVANGQTITSSHVGQLRLPDGTALTAYSFPDISGSLLSVSQLVDHGYTAVYNAEKVKFIKDDAVIFSGTRDHISRLWMVDLTTLVRSIAPALPAQPVVSAAAAAVYAAPAVRLQSKEEHVRYWHACFGFPSKSTFVQALKD